MSSSVAADHNRGTPATGLKDGQKTTEEEEEKKKEDHAESGEPQPSLPPEPPSEQPVADSDAASSSSPDLAEDAVVPPKYSVYTTWEKRWIVISASLAAFFSPVTAQIYLPYARPQTLPT